MSFRKDITVFTPLVTTVGDVELKCKIVHDVKWSYLEPQDEVTLLPQDEVTLFPQEEANLLPQEEATLLPHDEAILLPHDEATLLPHEAANDEPAIPFITLWAVDGDV